LVTDALVEFVADVMHLSVVDSIHFKKLLNMLNPMYQLPSWKYLSTKLLKKKYDHTKTTLLNQLQDINNINLTLDLWSNRQMRSYLHGNHWPLYFTSDLWTLESVVLSCNHVTGRHRAENIVLWYDEITSDFGISDKVKHSVIDSASNV